MLIRTNIKDIVKPYSSKKEKTDIKPAESESKIKAILFTWRPGISPVKMPVRTPRKQNNKTSIKSKI